MTRFLNVRSEITFMKGKKVLRREKYINIVIPYNIRLSHTAVFIMIVFYTAYLITWSHVGWPQFPWRVKYMWSSSRQSHMCDWFQFHNCHSNSEDLQRNMLPLVQVPWYFIHFKFTWLTKSMLGIGNGYKKIVDRERTALVAHSNQWLVS